MKLQARNFVVRKPETINITMFFKKFCIATRTIKTPDFYTKSGAFLTFWRKMGRSKMPWGIAAGIVPKNAFSENREFQTFFRCFVFHISRYLFEENQPAQ